MPIEISLQQVEDENAEVFQVVVPVANSSMIFLWTISTRGILCSRILESPLAFDPVHLGHHQLHHCHHRRALDVLHLIIKKIFWQINPYIYIYRYTRTASPSWHILWLKLTWPHLSHCLMAVLGHTPFLYRPAHPISYCWLYILYFTHTINHIPIASPFSSNYLHICYRYRMGVSSTHFMIKILGCRMLMCSCYHWFFFCKSSYTTRIVN